MPVTSPFWQQIRQLAETVNANGDRTENLKGAVYDLRATKPAEQTQLLLELNVALLALQEMTLLIASKAGAA